MRFRLGGCAVALVLVLSACGEDSASDGAAPEAAAEPLAVAELASARDTLPPAPHTATALTVLLAHDGAAGDPGLDAAAGALAQRPDIAVVVAVTGTGTETMSGLPVIAVADDTPSGFVAGAVAATGQEPDLVVVGIQEATDLGAGHPLARAAVGAGVPALVVQAERAGQVDHAAAALQLLEVLDLELGALLDEPAGIHRLTVPSCRAGSLRGRLAVRPGPPASPLVESSCATADRTVPTDEGSAVAAGYASLTRLP